MPVLGSVGEQKTKPTQHGVKELRGLGLAPDILICRSSSELLESTREKLGIFCQVPATHVVSVHDVANIYHVPLLLQQQHVEHLLHEKLELARDKGIVKMDCAMGSWETMAHAVDSYREKVTIALVGKYTGLQDSYLSVFKALKHSAIEARRRLELFWIDSSHLVEDDDGEACTEAWRQLESADGVVVPGGFGSRGIEGMIAAVAYCRARKKPYLGICLGMQLMAIEYARAHLPGKERITSREFDDTATDVAVVFMPEIDKTTMGGTMRLGARETLIGHDKWSRRGEPSIASLIYDNKATVNERHRHRYEVNPTLVPDLEQAGLRFIGKDETAKRMEIIELPRSVHPYFFGTQCVVLNASPYSSRLGSTPNSSRDPRSRVRASPGGVGRHLLPRRPTVLGSRPRLDRAFRRALQAERRARRQKGQGSRLRSPRRIDMTTARPARPFSSTTPLQLDCWRAHPASASLPTDTGSRIV